MVYVARSVPKFPVPGRSLWWLAGAGTAGILVPVLIGSVTAVLVYFPVGSSLPPIYLLSFVGTAFMTALVAFTVVVAGSAYSLVARSWRPFLLSIVLFGAMVPGVYPGVMAHLYLKKVGFEMLADRGALLTEAIHEFERTTGSAPDTLADLVPQYLAEIPATGMSKYPSFEYARAPGMCPEDNAWNISMLVGEALNFDMFIYCPKQNYPRDVGGNWIERVGAWAYMHE